MSTVGQRERETRKRIVALFREQLWLNLELIKKPPECLDYIIVHELAHLMEWRHNERFTSILESALPRWRLAKAELNAAPLADEVWRR